MRNGLTRGMTLAATLALVPLAAGCGSDNKSAISKSEFLKKGNASCMKGNRQIEQTANKTFTQKKRPSQAKLTKFATGTLVPVVQREIDDLRALGAPKGDKDKVDAIVNSAQAGLDKGKKDPTLLVNEKKDPFKEANRLAKDYGLTACAGS